jgi:hypothetical protein
VEITTVSSLKRFRITKRFLSGVLQGITVTDEHRASHCSLEVGQVVRECLTSSMFVVVAVEVLEAK